MPFPRNQRFLSAVVAALLAAGLLIGCGGASRATAEPPTGGLSATPGEGSVTLTWNATPGVEYWLVYAAAPSISATPTPTINHAWVQGLTSPFVITGLTNGVTYSFAMNGRFSGGAGGPSTPSVSAVPRSAGGEWTLDTTTSGAQMASTDRVTGMAFDGYANFMSVSNTGATYKGTPGTSGSMVWTAATTFPAYSFKAVTYANVTDGFVAVGAGGYCRAIDTSSPVCTTTSQTWNSVASNGAQTVIVGNGGQILHSDSVGGAWLAGTGATGNLNGVAFIGTNWFAVGAAGAIYKSSDAISWTSVAVTGGPLGALKGLASFGNFVIAVGEGGTVGISTDAGLTWTAQAPIVGAPVLNAVLCSYNQILVIANNGNVYTSPLQSTPAWTLVGSNSTKRSRDLLAVFGSSSKYFAVGVGGVSIYSR